MALMLPPRPAPRRVRLEDNEPGPAERLLQEEDSHFRGGAERAAPSGKAARPQSAKSQGGARGGGAGARPQSASAAEQRRRAQEEAAQRRAPPPPPPSVAANIALLEAVTPERLRELSKPRLIDVVSDLLAMAAQTEQERAYRFDTALAELEARRKTSKLTAAERQRRQLDKDKRWLAESKARTAKAALEERQKQSAVKIQTMFRGKVARGDRAARERAAKMRTLQSGEFQEQVSSFAAEKRAAAVLCRVWRGFVARKAAAKLRKTQHYREQLRALERGSGDFALSIVPEGDSRK